MNTTVKKIFRWQIFLVLILLAGDKLSSQNCLAMFNHTIGANGNVTFASTSTLNASTTTYYWNFGSANNPTIASTTATLVNATYTASGIYVISLTISATSPTCFSVYTDTIVITVCSVSFSTSPSTGSLCNGSATPQISGTICGIPTYTWLPGGTTGMSPNNLCPGTHTMLASGFGSVNCCPFVSGTVSIGSTTPCPLVANFTDTVKVNGVVDFISNSAGTNSLTHYSWNFGDGSPAVSGFNLPQVSHTYSNNQIYNATLTLTQNTLTGCNSSYTKSLTVSTLSCNLFSDFYYTKWDTVFTFVSISTGTNSSSLYTWHFGDGKSSGPSASPTANHTYTGSGTYYPYLIVNNVIPSSCIDTSAMNAHTVVVVPCGIKSSFTHTLTGNKKLSFKSTSTGTVSTSTYLWFFGDGNFGSGLTPQHTYSAAGFYTVQLKAKIDTNCFNISSQVIKVDTISCSVAAALMHTVGSSGVVQFQSAASGTNLSYFWHFGDGWTAVAPAPTHTYSNAGTHYVEFIARDAQYPFCADTVTQAINITGVSCVANSNFTMVPGTQPQHWILIPQYPYNVVAAHWDWGDGYSSNTLFASHVYISPGTYSICLSVTVSCDDSSSLCVSQQVFRTSGEPQQLIYVNVQAPPLRVGISEEIKSMPAVLIYPNPGDGKFYINRKNTHTEAEYRVSDVLGRNIAEGRFHGNTHKIDISDQPEGPYFIRIREGNTVSAYKLLIRQ